MATARSKVAASAASVIPFSCVICFEEFNLTDRNPMVLPCGHTYVCGTCTKRLKRCMECREPLFLTLPSSFQGNNAPSCTVRPIQQQPSMSRSAPCPGQKPCPGNHAFHPGYMPLPVNASQPTQVPLPIPKNVVLMAIMEASERQKCGMESHFENDQCERYDEGDSDSAIDDDDSEIDEEEEEKEEGYNLNHIISGMSTLSGPCGTYSVKNPEGLAVVPNDPNKRQPVEEEKKSDGGVQSDEMSDVLEPFLLRRGQTVQVVDFDGGVARLARGQGYIVASSSQLVKVQGPLDTACRIEGLLNTMISRGHDLQQELDNNAKCEESLRRQLGEALREAPVYPIITEVPELDDVFPSKCLDSEQAQTQHPINRTSSGCRTPDSSVSSASSIAESQSSDAREVADENVLATFPSNRDFPKSPNSIDNADIRAPGFPNYRRNSSNDDLHQLAFGCGTDLIRESTHIFGLSGAGGSDVLRGLALEENSNQRADRESSKMGEFGQNSPKQTSSFDSVDFRTGLSGHRALNTSVKLGHSPTPRREIRMMGEHRGISGVRGNLRRRDNPSLGPLFAAITQSK